MSPERANTATADAPDAPAPSPALLFVVLSGTAMVVLDVFIVNAAIPAIGRDFHSQSGTLEWPVAGYGLAFGAGLITAGRLGDHLGRRRMFGWGLALFTVTSALCGLATGMGTLIAARVAQGLAAALLIPQVTAIINSSYRNAARVRAFTAYAITLGLAAVAGQLIGGGLIAADLAGLGWRSCFLVNVPVGIAALASTRRWVPAFRPSVQHSLDLVGALLITGALVAAVFPLVEGPARGWPWWCLACPPLAAALFVVFGLVEERVAARGGSPILPPALYRERAFAVGLASVVVFYASVASWFFVLALYLQDGRHLTPLHGGLVFSVLGAGFLATSLVAGRVLARLGRRTLILGAALRALAMLGLWLAVRRLGTGGSTAWLAAPLAVDGAGQGLVTGPLLSGVLAGVPTHLAGAASGVLSSAQQVGNSLGVAAIGAAYFAVLGSGEHVSAAFGAALLVLAALNLLVAVLTRQLPDSPTTT